MDHPEMEATGMKSLCCLLLAGLLAPVAAESEPQNLVYNGSFDKGSDVPDGWHIRLADYMPQRICGPDKDLCCHFYVCGCGEYLGTFKPWAGLACPACKGFICAEESGDWYARNHELISLDQGKSGKAIKFVLPRAVGENQGVRVFSRMFPVKRAWGYVLEFDTKAKGAHPRVFVESFHFPEKTQKGPPLLRAEDIEDAQALCAKLSAQAQEDKPSAGKRLWELLSAEARPIVTKAVENELTEQEEEQLVKGLNAVLSRKDFYQPNCFPEFELHQKVREFLERTDPAPSAKEIQWINRHILSVCFPEGTKRTPEDPEGCRAIDISGIKRNIVKEWRGHVNCEGAGDWTHYTKEMAPRKKYPYDWMTVKLYAYMPGEAWFDNVVVRAMTKKELEDYFAKRPDPKDKRFDFDKSLGED
jgi:hypothetical protein